MTGGIIGEKGNRKRITVLLIWGQQEALQPAQPSKEALVEDSVEILSAVRDVYPQINETLEAVVLDGSMNTLLKVPVSEVIKRLNSAEGGKLPGNRRHCHSEACRCSRQGRYRVHCGTSDDRLEETSRYPNQDI